MPDELKQEAEEIVEESKKEGFFDDLPPEKQEEGKKEESSEEEKQTLLEKQKKLEIALSKEREKRKALKEQITELKKTTEEEGEDDKEEKLDIEKVVEEKLTKKEKERYESAIVSEIKLRAKTKEEAELMKHYVDNLFEHTGDPKTDLRRAMAWMDVLKTEKESGGIPSPMSSGYGDAFAPAEPEGKVSKSAVEFGKKYLGRSEEDWKKYGDGKIKLTK